MQDIDDPIIGPLERLDSAGSWQRPFEFPGFLTATLHFESEVSIAAGDAGHLMQWATPNHSQQVAFLRLQQSSAALSLSSAYRHSLSTLHPLVKPLHHPTGKNSAYRT